MAAVSAKKAKVNIHGKTMANTKLGVSSNCLLFSHDVSYSLRRLKTMRNTECEASSQSLGLVSESAEDPPLVLTNTVTTGHIGC